MMAMLWVVLFLASSGLYTVNGLPIGPTPQAYPHDSNGIIPAWGTGGGLYALPALALVITAVGLLFGCTWCYRHNDCKLFTASATHLHDARRSQPPDSGFSEPVNNNISEDNNNGPISLREMQNIANNNAAAYIISENEERNRVRDSVVEFEPLPSGIRVLDPLERCADWFGGEDFPRSQLQYLREIGRGWFGRVVEGEVEDGPSSTTVAVKILNQNASLEDKARFLDEARMYRDISHENVLPFIAKCLTEDPWLLMFELCSMDLQQYLEMNRPKMAILNESGVPLQLMCDVSSGLAHLHSRGFLYGTLWSGTVLVRGTETVRAVLGQYSEREPAHQCTAPELERHPPVHTGASEVWSLGCVVWEVCAWGAPPPRRPPPPHLPCPYRAHLYQVMQLCWNPVPENRPTAAQVHALLNHLHTTHSRTDRDDSHFEERWQRLKPNTIPKIDEHVAIVHAPSTSTDSQFGSDPEFESAHTLPDSLSVGDTAVSRSSSIMSDREPLSVQIKSDSLNNLHGSFEDVGNIYLTHNEAAAMDCHQGNIGMEEKDQDRSDSSVDPWLKDIIQGSQDDVSYFKDVSDVIKNLDNILNSEKTSSSESSHQASPSRDNLSLECKKDYPMQTSLVKSPGIRNFQNILEMGFDSKSEENQTCEDDVDRDTIGTLSHSFERHSDSTSQYTLENITPETPIKDFIPNFNESPTNDQNISLVIENKQSLPHDNELPNDSKLEDSDINVPKLKELCEATIPSLSNGMGNEKDCTSHDSNVNVRTDTSEQTKSIDLMPSEGIDKLEEVISISETNEEQGILQEMASEEIPMLNNSSDKNIDNVLVTPLVSKDLSFLSDSKIEKSEASALSEGFKNLEYNVLQTHDIENEVNDFHKEDVKFDEGNVSIDNIEEQEHLPLISDERIHIETLDTVVSVSDNTDIAENKHVVMPDQVESLEIKVADDVRLPTLVESPVEKYHCSPSKSDLSVDNKVVPVSLGNSEAFLKAEREAQQKQLCEVNIHKELQSIPVTDIKGDVALDFEETFDRNKDKELNDEMPVPGTKTVNLVEFDNISLSESAKLQCEHDVIPSDTNKDIDHEIKQITSPLDIVLQSSNTNEELIEKQLNVESAPLLEVKQTNLENVADVSELPDSVQISDSASIDTSNTLESHENLLKIQPDTPEIVQNTSREIVLSDSQLDESVEDQATVQYKSLQSVHDKVPSESTESTVYMDLSSNTNNEIFNDNNKENIQDVSYMEICDMESIACGSGKNESTVYLDLPNVIREMDVFLHSEKILSSRDVEVKDSNEFKDENVCSSTPLGSNSSVENVIDDVPDNETLVDPAIPDYGPGVSVTKLEQKSVPESLSPFESPTKSHHTDTYDENSSVVLGPFENCTLELYKGLKSGTDFVDLPKEEILAFSSNFSEINLETPSPLRDGNFLNEVPDLLHDDLQYNDPSTSESKPVAYESPDNNTDETSTTEKRVSPSTPPNSPGNFLASTSQPTYIVDIDLEANEPIQNIDMNEIDMQMTAKLAMAENENNMNIEYSGPLEEVVLDETMSRSNDALPESYLAGNGGPVEDAPENSVIDEERMKELRNELELKLPLAQVAGIEPATSWTELPPPPELLVTYGALSPIAEETKCQLSAYENDDNYWNLSGLTESSSSCGEAARSVGSEPPSAPNHSTYTVCTDRSRTYTLPPVTMSADSLNASPLKKAPENVTSPINDRTYNKDDEENESNCERISQVSPFLLSPSTDISAPDNSDLNAALSTLSKITVPTDAKSSKPSETQCLSKATSIDSWCSNDTLYNVEENFDDLAMDPDIPLDFEPEQDAEKSESEDTLTHNGDDKELSHCSTYIVHDSKSEACETFSPDSITANDNYTYTKMKTGTTPSVNTELNDSTKNTQTKDLAYGTLASGMPSYSNCTTELASGFDDTWKLPQPELVRRSPVPDDVNFTPPQQIEDKSIDCGSPQVFLKPSLKKMDSVEITCFNEQSGDMEHSLVIEHPLVSVEVNDSPNINFKDMAHTVTSTPVTETDNDKDNVEAIPCDIPNLKVDQIDSEMSVNSLTNFQSFLHSVEIRPQDISSNNSKEGGTNSDTDIFESDSKIFSKNSNADSLAVSKKTMSYSDFENSAVTKPQDLHSRQKSSQSMESGVGSEDFRNFETSVRDRPQDLSSLIDASSLLLKSERRSSEIAANSFANKTCDIPEQSTSKIPPEPSIIINPTFKSFRESPEMDVYQSNIFITDLDIEDENEQPHSIIITESPLLARMSTSNSFDSHKEENRKMHFDSHVNERETRPFDISPKLESKVNGMNAETTQNRDDSTKSNVLISPSGSEEKNDKVSNEPVETKQPDEDKQEDSIKCNGSNEVFATVNFLNEPFEELLESNVDDNESNNDLNKEMCSEISTLNLSTNEAKSPEGNDSESYVNIQGVNGDGESQATTVTEDFLQNEKKFCQLDSYLPLLSDIRFTGPGSEIMSTSFSQDSPTEPTSPECDRESGTEKLDKPTDLLKEWDSDTDSHSTNSSSGEFIWKQRDSGQPSRVDDGSRGGGSASNDSCSGSGSGSGSEGDEVEFVPSSWDCRAAPSKSSLRSLEQPADGKKRVVFKRQKYHCVYEYPREACDELQSPAHYLPDLSTYCDWDPSSVEEAEAGYGQLFGSPAPLDMLPLRAGIAFGADYDDDFFISSSARPFELGVLSTTSQFFPGMHLKQQLVPADDFPSPSPPPPATLPPLTPTLDFTTPDSGVEDITPGSTIDDDFKKISEDWKPDSTSSSESVSPSSPGGEALGGLRHTRDKLKLDLPPSPHLPSPRHNRVFNFVLEKPKRPSEGTTPLVMSDETPVITMALPMSKERDDPMPEPTFSTFGKTTCNSTADTKNIVLDEEKDDKVEPVKGEGTVLDSGDEDSGIESSSKATLERKPADVS
ncbi:uncharacterized protein LOC123695871 isoform X2 [Colias croceus]|uniref:uncharacterized protein LOC123695871 isoform X2 n=1 Tax=Colias crocea TaxID=72248 RepID=UPI001E27AAAC|nr:uncharacterized protein LOC123695871 isoform X2 [Colias croceus]